MFEKLNAFTKKVADLSDKPALTPSELKAQFDAAPDEVRQYLNKLIDALTKTTLGDSGAKNIGATTISGLTGSDVQTILESLKAEFAKYTAKTDIGNFISGSSGTIGVAGGSYVDVTVNYGGKFTSTPFLTFSLFNTDVDGNYTTASSIIANNKDGATIRVKNKAGSGNQYYIVYWRATDK